MNVELHRLQAQENTCRLGRTASFQWGSASDRGRVRPENEDALFVEPEIGLFLVSDGMGGHRGGALASKIVTEDLPVLIENALHELRSASPRAIRAVFKRSIAEQSRQLWMEGISESGYKDMGATLAAVLLQNHRAYIANLGDSRIYRLRKGRLVQLSKDHSVVSELLREGTIAPAEAANHTAQGEITHYVGMEEPARPYVRSFALKKADRLMLCTDGLTDMVSDKQIASVLVAEGNPQAACEQLVRAANNASGDDNITVVVVDWLV